MQLNHLSLLCLALLASLQGVRSHPLHTGLSGDDADLLKSLLLRLEESLPAETGMDQPPVERLDSQVPARRDGAAEEEEELQARLDEAAIRGFLSAKDLKSVRNTDTSRRSSTCFGGRMDRIGAMSSLGCNTASRFSPRRR